MRIIEQAPIDRLVAPFQKFARISASSSLLLAAAAAIALVWANSPWSGAYHKLWANNLSIALNTAAISKTLLLWINNGLMAFVFFIIGLEIKREIIVGELTSKGQAVLPLAAALGGMLVPAGVYAAINWGEPTSHGWGIPMATDFVMVLGVLALLGQRAPLGLKVFVTAAALADDLGAMLVIAVVYSKGLSLYHLGLSAILLAAMAVGNMMGVRRPVFFWVLGAGLWMACLEAGVHPALAGALAALTIPATMRCDAERFVATGRRVLDDFQRAAPAKGPFINQEQLHALYSLAQAGQKVTTPLQRLEFLYHPWVAFVVLPLYALANFGAPLTEAGRLAEPLGMGVFLGLVAGKPAGMLIACVLLTKAVGLSLPRETTWPQMLGAACLAGMGFSMSAFKADLAMDSVAYLNQAKIAILAATAVSAVCGASVLWAAGRKK